MPNISLKRTVDIAVVALAAPAALGIVGLLGALIRLESPGSPVFRQVRCGKNGKRFTMYKLRTMVENAEQIGAGLYYQANDPRFTRLGTLVRRLSLDEVPQLYNVLRGDMSLVGPRPMLPVTVDEYPEQYAVILQVLPGLTGLAQVSGRNELSRKERMALDMRYARTWSLGMDLRILAATLGAVVSGAGQRVDQSRDDVEK